NLRRTAIRCGGNAPGAPSLLFKHARDDLVAITGNPARRHALEGSLRQRLALGLESTVAPERTEHSGGDLRVERIDLQDLFREKVIAGAIGPVELQRIG